MLRFSRHLVGASALALLSQGASAQNIQGVYLGGAVGAIWQEKDKGLAGPSSFSVDFSTGAVGLLSLGHGFGNGFRVEIEGSFNSSEVDSSNVAGSAANGSGRYQSVALMANVLYDLDLRLIGLDTRAIVPYVGVGLGYHIGITDNVRLSKSTTNITSDGDGGRLAYQIIAGLSFPIASVPGLALTTEYRYFMTDIDNGPEITFSDSASGRSTINNTMFSYHAVLLGLRYAFNPAPAVAAAAAPVASARTFLVFFDWSKADLTDRARQIIGEAASARGQGVTRIEVNGFTDRSGPADYNVQLSIRRADAVAAELVRRGVPRNEIVTRGFGEENNLVPTADGVREPQNRRVEIILK